MAATLFHTVTLFRAYPDMVKKLGAALVAFAVPTREEPGCRRFEVYQDCVDPTRFTMIGDWTDESAHRDHLNAQHTLEAFHNIPPMLDGEAELREYFATSSP